MAEAGSVYIASYNTKFNMAAVASDAATMLAEALQKMDGLISDDQLIMEGLKGQPHSCTMKERVVSLAEELRAQLEELSLDARSIIDVSESSASFLINWLESLQVNNNKHCLSFYYFTKAVMICTSDNA